MSLVHEQAAFLKDIRKLLEFADGQNLIVTGGELARSTVVPAPGLSYRSEDVMDDMHIRKCAIDLYFFTEYNDRLALEISLVRLEPLGAYWESLDPRNRWGGRGIPLMDMGHFERNLGAWPSSMTSELMPSLVTMDIAAVSTAERPGTVLLSSPANSRPTLRRGRQDRSGILLLQEKLVQLKLLETATGEFDQKTEAAVTSFQRKNNLIVDGIVGEKTWSTLDAALSGTEQPNTRWLSDADLDNTAKQLPLELPILRAVYQVESNGRGFVGEHPKILFEGHVFWRRLEQMGQSPQQLSHGNEDILYPKWTKAYYGNAEHERDRLRRAQAINPTAALESASWGLFQIMGYQWEKMKAAYNSVDDFVEKMKKHEREQLNAFCCFIEAVKIKNGKSLADMLRDKDWMSFSYYYNGPRYRENAYDDKLRTAYMKFRLQTAE